MRCTWILILLIVTLPGWSQNLLPDPGFEGQPPNTLGPPWAMDAFGNAGSTALQGIGRFGTKGAKSYTGAAGTHWYSGIYPQTVISAAPGDVFEGTIYARQEDLMNWVPGSLMMLRLMFLGENGQVLASVASAPHPGGTAWQALTVKTGTAPPGTTAIRFLAILTKPAGSAAAMSVCRWDDAYLARTAQNQPLLDVYPRVAGVPPWSNQTTVTIENVGQNASSWQLTGGSGIGVIQPSTGTLQAGATVNVQIQVPRAVNSGVTHGEVTLTYGSSSETIRVMIAPVIQSDVPTEPAIVTTLGRRLVIQPRLPDGSLGPRSTYDIRGMAWSPASRGTLSDNASRRLEFHEWYVADVMLMKELGVNTVYLYLDPLDTYEGKAVLDFLYRQGMMAVITVDEGRLLKASNGQPLNRPVATYRNHPAVLMWSIGIEWAINGFYTEGYNMRSGAQVLAMADEVQRRAALIKQLDSHHPVASSVGDMALPTDTTPYQSIKVIEKRVPAVDVWAFNVYRGASFGDLFTAWRGISTKPMMVTEFGADAFRTTRRTPSPPLGYVDLQAQGLYLDSLLGELQVNRSVRSIADPELVCVGAFLFEFNDEWWKSKVEHGGSPDRQDTLGYPTDYNPLAQPDAFANEEYFGIFDIDRRPREPAVSAVTAWYTASYNHAPIAWPDAYSTRTEVPLVVDAANGILANDGDADGDTLTIELVQNVSRGTLDLNLTTGQFTYTPASGYIGPDAFSYRLSDGSIRKSNVATVSITVRPRPPIMIYAYSERGATHGQQISTPEEGVGYLVVEGMGTRITSIIEWQRGSIFSEEWGTAGARSASILNTGKSDLLMLADQSATGAGVVAYRQLFGEVQAGNSVVGGGKTTRLTPVLGGRRIIIDSRVPADYTTRTLAARVLVDSVDVNNRDLDFDEVVAELITRMATSSISGTVAPAAVLSAEVVAPESTPPVLAAYLMDRESVDAGGGAIVRSKQRGILVVDMVSSDGKLSWLGSNGYINEDLSIGGYRATVSVARDFSFMGRSSGDATSLQVLHLFGPLSNTVTLAPGVTGRLPLSLAGDAWEHQAGSYRQQRIVGTLLTERTLRYNAERVTLNEAMEELKGLLAR